MLYKLTYSRSASHSSRGFPCLPPSRLIAWSNNRTNSFWRAGVGQDVFCLLLSYQMIWLFAVLPRGQMRWLLDCSSFTERYHNSKVIFKCMCLRILKGNYRQQNPPLWNKRQTKKSRAPKSVLFHVQRKVWNKEEMSCALPVYQRGKVGKNSRTIPLDQKR